MTKAEIQKYDAQEKMLAEAGLMDEESYVPDTLALPTIKIDTDKVKGKSNFYLDDGGEITDLPATLEVVPVVAQKIRAMFEEGSEKPICAGVNGLPSTPEPKADRCIDCKYGDYGGLCKPKVRLFLMFRQEGEKEWSAAVLLLPPTSIKHWDRYISRLSRNKPKPLRHFQIAAKINLQHIVKEYKWDEIVWGELVPLNNDDLQNVIALHSQIKPLMQDIDSSDYSEKGDKPYDKSHGETPATSGEAPASKPGHVEEPKQKRSDSTDSEQSDIPF